MRVVVTFCNQHASPRLSACAVDLASGERAWLPTPDTFSRGAAGATAIGDDLLVACQPGGVVRYSPALAVSGMLPTPGARNLHSILYRATEHSLYVVSAHNDTLFRYRLDDEGRSVVESEAVYCADPRRRNEDRYHLNSVAEWNGDLYVTLFGEADGPMHTHRRNGRVVRVRDGATIVEGLYHPHSLFVHNDELLVIESQARTVRRVAGGVEASWAIDAGYPRGIAAESAAVVWVGVSALRKESESLGTRNVVTSSNPLDFCTRIVELDLATGAQGRTLDLSPLAAEIFDLVPLDDAAPFRPDPDGGLGARIDALQESHAELRGELRAARAEAEANPWRRARRLTRRVARRLRRPS
ncbi:MAG TPA: DUF4915 domain-containing protein [Acidimicrobiia bacterium]|nr:DUF4915 domain-containing protein [Acidimicrobiia bacterium]